MSSPQALDVISFQIDVAHFSRCKCKWCLEHSSFASVATSYFNMVTFLVPWKTMDIQLAHLCSVWQLFKGQTKKLVFLKTSFFRDGHFKGAIKRAFLPPNYFGPSISLKNIRPNHLPKEFHPLLKTIVCPPATSLSGFGSSATEGKKEKWKRMDDQEQMTFFSISTE